MKRENMSGNVDLAMDEDDDVKRIGISEEEGGRGKLSTTSRRGT
jgi:hypothetical protein